MMPLVLNIVHTFILLNVFISGNNISHMRKKYMSDAGICRVVHLRFAIVVYIHDFAIATYLRNIGVQTIGRNANDKHLPLEIMCIFIIYVNAYLGAGILQCMQNMLRQTCF
jgi:hypothetical protein